MAVHTPRWERRLLDLAHQGSTEFQKSFKLKPGRDPLLDEAYRICERITADHSRSFHFASRFMPGEKRRAIRALYAFCRVTDDIVDEPKPNAAAALKQWRARAVRGDGEATDPVSRAWLDARRRFGVPRVYAEQLVDGVARDLGPVRYASFEALSHYCYGVASTVGLMSMHIIGFRDPAAIRYAVKMGVALQLTNILRDVGEDLTLGRLYLPADELRRYGIRQADLIAGRVDSRSAPWRNFMRYQIGRARRLYREAWPGIALLHRDGRFSVMAAAELYGGILTAIEANRYDVFGRRAHLSAGQKVKQLPSIWLRSRLGLGGRLQLQASK